MLEACQQMRGANDFNRHITIGANQYEQEIWRKHQLGYDLQIQVFALW